MKLDDALFNWLQIRVVADARPDDDSAVETARFFHEMLTEDHQLTELTYTVDETMYMLRYIVDGKRKTQMYDKEAVEQLLTAIQNEPKYN